MKNFFTILIVLLPVLAEAQEFEQIKIDLKQIFERNIELRTNVMPTVEKYGFGSAQMDSLDRVILTFDSISLIKVIGIIDLNGWLGISKIGEILNQSLFLTIQHAQNKELRIKYFPLLKASAEQGESSLSDMATMMDRMLVENGKDQLYGTQSRMVNNELEYFPIENPENVNRRRRKVGLKKIKVK